MSDLKTMNKDVEEFPLVSIITPSFNQAEFLEATIQSVLNQDYPNVEYLVIDGGSTDGSKEILEKYDRDLSFWVSEPDSGQTEAINKGFARARGKYIAWINSDDVYYPQAISEAVAYLNATPDVGLVYGDADFINAQGDQIGRFNAAQTSYQQLRRGYVHIPQQAAFFQRRFWEMVGPLDPSFFFAMDYDLWVRLAAITTIVYHPQTWAAFRLHGDAKSLSAADRCWPEMMRVHERLGGSRFSVIYAKYLLRKILEPILPYRLHARLWLQRWALGREVRITKS
jgi:glycosyltransferase involved in cell wall biosynthesis